MRNESLQQFIAHVIENMPKDWLNLTTHRLDIYDEGLAKTQFLQHFEALFEKNKSQSEDLKGLPTAFDYIRLGHPLSCVLEWVIAKMVGLSSDRVISFSSKTIPILAILRKNLIDKKPTKIIYINELPANFNDELFRGVYGYSYELIKVQSIEEIEQNSNHDGSVILVTDSELFSYNDMNVPVDFVVKFLPNLGSLLLIDAEVSSGYIDEVQHVRRRETIAMTPANSFIALNKIIGQSLPSKEYSSTNKGNVTALIKEITGAESNPVVGSSGLSIQYAILMGLIHEAQEKFQDKEIKIIVPPNCYGGTNDQARRIASCLENVEVMDLPVDGGNDMVSSIDRVLNSIAEEDAIPIIIAEIPTNPRVEVPELIQLEKALARARKTIQGGTAIEPIFVLDQTFCPNVHFLRNEDVLSSVLTISYVSGSKFPSGGKCTAGYCIANAKASHLMSKIETHLHICDNEATGLQYELLANQMPSMLDRIEKAYINTREFVTFIQEVLPKAKINFVSEKLAAEGFRPSVFSLDLPTKGNTSEEKEAYKREMNLKLIDLMITKIPNESKYCVSYGQLKGCYWTIPATSTQGTTKEGDKDYIARVALSPSLDLSLHKEVFREFVQEM